MHHWYLAMRAGAKSLSELQSIHGHHRSSLIDRAEVGQAAHTKGRAHPSLPCNFAFLQTPCTLCSRYAPSYAQTWVDQGYTPLSIGLATVLPSNPRGPRATTRPHELSQYPGGGYQAPPGQILPHVHIYVLIALWRMVALTLSSNFGIPCLTPQATTRPGSQEET